MPDEASKEYAKGFVEMLKQEEIPVVNCESLKQNEDGSYYYGYTKGERAKGDDPPIQLDSKLVNRKEDYEMVRLIKAIYAEISEVKEKSQVKSKYPTVHKIEEFIQNSDIKSRTEMIQKALDNFT